MSNKFFNWNFNNFFSLIFPIGKILSFDFTTKIFLDSYNNFYNKIIHQLTAALTKTTVQLFKESY
jgi:hypothetical protein